MLEHDIRCHFNVILMSYSVLMLKYLVRFVCYLLVVQSLKNSF